MRPILLALGLLVAFAGCLDDASDDTADDTPEETTPMQQAPPQPIEATGSFDASLDPLNIATGEICTSPSAQCDYHPFTITAGQAPVDLTATLNWGSPTNDLDLYLFASGAEISNDGINFVGEPPNNQQVMNVPGLGAGEYELVVVAWSSGPESYTLTAEFA